MLVSLQFPDNFHRITRGPRRPRVLGLCLTAALAVALAACSPSKPAPSVNVVGQPVQLGGQEVTIWSIAARSYVGDPAKPVRVKDGEVLILIRYDLHNTGSAPLVVASAPQVSLIDPTGGVHPSDPDLTKAYLSTSELKDAAPSLAPGATARQAVVFDVSASSYPRGWAIIVGDKTHRVEPG